MSEAFRYPRTVRVNAWTGVESPTGRFDAAQEYWGLRKHFSGDASSLGELRADEPVDDRDWAHPSVGWGLILPDDDQLDEKSKAVGADAPGPLQALLRHRKAPVLRWRPDLQDGFLRRYYEDGTPADLSVSGSKRGVDRNCVPRYLLIYGNPTTIPWRTQFLLNVSSFVGRLPALDDDPLQSYVDALINGWPGPAPSLDAPLIWTVDHGGDDITTLMRAVLGEALWDRFGTDASLTAKLWLDGASATHANLVGALRDRRPALIATTSHGLTGPLDDLAAMGAQLGTLVDAGYSALEAGKVLSEWNPGGAIWYAHACCSAGSEAPSRYSPLFPQNDGNGPVLRGIAELGASVAPFPRSLLSATHPLKAWIGHVEPTFDWTLYDPRTGQALATAVVRSLYDEMYRANAPVGWAMRRVFSESAEFFTLWQDARSRVDDGDTAYVPVATYRQLVAMDRQSTVLLGDPTVSLGA